MESPVLYLVSLRIMAAAEVVAEEAVSELQMSVV